MKLTYNQIYYALFSDGIEDYVPDGISISHPVIAMCNDTIVDCFLLYSMSRDGRQYTTPTARIIIDPIQKQLIEYKTVHEKPFSIGDQSKYYSYDLDENQFNEIQTAEMTFQEAYMDVREFAFSNHITEQNKDAIIRYLSAFKKVELPHLQPFLIEMGQDFFRWIRSSLQNKDE